ncbi:MAG: hypothetical protein ABSF03_01690 [Streptosporangiaceae bacterium]|jgi:hypothetical protein
MKRIIVAIIVIVVIIILAAIACGESSQSIPTLTGTWTGTYTCSQGLTGIRLVLQAKDGKLTGTENFFAVKGNPGVPSGSLTVTGTYSNTATGINPGHWIKQPAGYELEHLTAGPPEAGKLHGKVIPSSACTTFTVTKE